MSSEFENNVKEIEKIEVELARLKTLPNDEMTALRAKKLENSKNIFIQELTAITVRDKKDLSSPVENIVESNVEPPVIEINGTETNNVIPLPRRR